MKSDQCIIWQGIDKALMDALISRFAIDSWARNAAIGFYDGEAYLLRPITETAHVLDCILAAHFDVIASLGRHYRIPDVEFVISAHDEPIISAANNFNGTPWPMLRYCTKPGHSSDITVPGDFWYARDRWDVRMTCNHKPSRSVPWSNRTSKLVCNCGGYHRYGPFKGWNGTDGRSQQCCIEKEKPCVPCSGTRDYFRFNVAHKYPDLLQEGGLSPHLEDWSRYKYVLHLDGISCSTRLLPYLGLGFTTFVEQSGFQQHFQPWLKPKTHFIPVWKDGPQDLAPNVLWAREHDEQARRIGVNARAFALEHLKRESRERYWALVIAHFAQLLNYPVVKREGALPLVQNGSVPFMKAQHCRYIAESPRCPL